MIRILKENDNIENMTDEQIQQMYDEQKIRIDKLVQSKIDDIVKNFPKYKESIVKEIITDTVSSFYFDNDDLVIVAKTDDFEDRMYEIKEIMSLRDLSDDYIESDIDDIIIRIMSGE